VTTLYRIVKKKIGTPAELSPRWPDGEGGPDGTLEEIARRIVEYPVSARIVAVESGGVTRALDAWERHVMLEQRRIERTKAAVKAAKAKMRARR
jgi:hypothetical protein